MVVLAVSAGCAGRLEPFPDGAAARAELEAVPFFPQEAHQCGPAALATVLTYAAAPVDADVLVAEVYMPARQGSLQPEIVGAIRRRDRVPYALDRDLAALVAEIDAGRPVLVLQNLGVALIPYWHYAVVVGYDRSADRLVLRSGTTARRVERRTTFLRTWARSDHWGLVILAPGEIPASATPARYFAVLAALESVGRTAVAESGYRAMVERWPQAVEGHFGLGNVRLARGDWAGAEAAYRDALALRSDDVAVLNNLAMALVGRGCGRAAARVAEAALATVPPGDPRRAAVADTAQRARDAAVSADPSGCPP